MHVLMAQTADQQGATINGACADAQDSHQSVQHQAGERCNGYDSRVQSSRIKQTVLGQSSVQNIQLNGDYENKSESNGLVEYGRNIHGHGMHNGTCNGTKDTEPECEITDGEDKENRINDRICNDIVSDYQTRVKGSLPTSAKSGLTRTSPGLTNMTNIRMEYGATNSAKRQEIVSRAPTGTASTLTIHWEPDRSSGAQHQLQVKHITVADVEKERRYSRHKYGGTSDTEPLASGDGSDLNVTSHQSQEVKKLLMDIVYPHEYYDMFSRAGRRRFPVRKQDVSNFPRPSKVFKKFGEQDTNKPAVVGDKTYARNKLAPRRDEPSADVSSQNPEKWRRDEDGNKRDVHVNCRPKHDSVVIMDNADGQKLAISGLKGWLLKREESGKTKQQKDVKTSPYEISSLGMRFSLPEYNVALHTRRPMSPRPLTGVLAPTSLLNPVPSRPLTHGSGSRHHNVFDPSSFQKMLRRGTTCVQGREKTIVQKTEPSQDEETYRSHMQPYAGVHAVGYSKQELKMSLPSYNLQQSKTFL